MTSFADWLQVRPGERRAVVLAAVAAGLVMAFFTLARALRETLYLTAFPVTALPYVTAATAVVTLPAVSVFTRWLGRHRPRSVVLGLAGVVGGAALTTWPLLATSRAAVVAFYLITATGALLLASGFWVVIAEVFPVRDAKRFYGFVTAGGTLGTLAAGLSLGWLSRWLAVDTLVLAVVAVLALFSAVLARLPAGPRVVAVVDGPAGRADRASALPVRDAFLECARTPHLRGIAALVFVATVASSLVDFQFKAAAQAARPDAAALSSFLGAFYAWTGAAALVIQLFVAPKLLNDRGIGGSLAALPVTLVAGAVALLLVPGVAVATLLRACDNTLRRSIQRPVIEVLYVPVDAAARRRTKTFIDTVVDAGAEAVGAALVVSWVTLGALPLRGLAGHVLVLGAMLLVLGRRMAAEYRRTVVSRLHEAAADVAAREGGPAPRDLFTASFARLDLSGVLKELPRPADGAQENVAGNGPAPRTAAAPPLGVLDRLRSADNAVATAALADLDRDDPAQFAAAVKLLARDPVREAAGQALLAAGPVAWPGLVAALGDATTPFAVRRRLPHLLADVADATADDALLDALAADRFEVRYRAGVALGRRRRAGQPVSSRDWPRIVWDALAAEVARDRPIWELQRLLDGRDQTTDDWLVQQVDVRGGLSLEHTFRLLSLVLDPAAVAASFQGIAAGDPHLRGYALEFLEQVLSPDLRRRLWVFIGDVSDRQREREQRPLDDVVRDLMNSRATLFPGETGRLAVRRLLDAQSSPPADDERGP